MSNATNTAIKMQENLDLEEDNKETDLSKIYKNLNEQCDVVLEKIKKRKTRQSKQK